MLLSPVRRPIAAVLRLRAGGTCTALLLAVACAGVAVASPASAEQAAPAAVVAPSAAAAVPGAEAASAPPEDQESRTPAADAAAVPEAPGSPDPSPVVESRPDTDATADEAALTAPVADQSPATPGVTPQVATEPRATVSRVAAAATAPVVTAQPKEMWVDLGKSAIFTAHASGSPKPTVQWQSRRWYEDPWTNIPGATSDAYVSPPASLTDVEPSYRAVFTNSAGSVATDAADLRMNDLPPAAGTPSAPRDVKARQTAPGQITITWDAPTSQGTSPIISYGAGYGTRRWGNGDDFSPTTFKAVFDDVPDGDYTAVVFATNDSGISRRVVVPISVGDLPSEPRKVEAKRSGSSVTVSWGVPTRAGYSPVGSYDVVLTSATARVTRTVPAGATSVTYSNLPAGTYRVVVTATTKVGAGPAATLFFTVPAKPQTQPTKPAKASAATLPLAAPRVAVASAPQAPAAAAAATLAHTGVSGSAQAGLALGLLALGLAFGFAARRLRDVGCAA